VIESLPRLGSGRRGGSGVKGEKSKSRTAGREEDRGAIEKVVNLPFANDPRKEVLHLKVGSEGPKRCRRTLRRHVAVGVKKECQKRAEPS